MQVLLWSDFVTECLVSSVITFPSDWSLRKWNSSLDMYKALNQSADPQAFLIRKCNLRITLCTAAHIIHPIYVSLFNLNVLEEQIKNWDKYIASNNEQDIFLHVWLIWLINSTCSVLASTSNFTTIEKLRRENILISNSRRENLPKLFWRRRGILEKLFWRRREKPLMMVINKYEY